MIIMKRRTFLKGSVAGSMLAVAAGAGLLAPRSVLAAWPETAFTATSLDAAIDALLGSSAATESSDIKIKAPDIAENGAVVPITVSTGMAADSISVFIAKNPSPLACSFALGGATQGFISTRVKMGKTSELIAVVKSGGKLYSAKKTVKVTIGGCGG
jgi:sulfur-oxidizing protein SoxY